MRFLTDAQISAAGSIFAIQESWEAETTNISSRRCLELYGLLPFDMSFQNKSVNANNQLLPGIKLHVPSMHCSTKQTQGKKTMRQPLVNFILCSSLVKRDLLLKAFVWYTFELRVFLLYANGHIIYAIKSEFGERQRGIGPWCLAEVPGKISFMPLFRSNNDDFSTCLIFLIPIEDYCTWNYHCEIMKNIESSHLLSLPTNKDPLWKRFQGFQNDSRK